MNRIFTLVTVLGVGLSAAATPAQTPTPTPLGPGPRVSYFGAVNQDGCPSCCGGGCGPTPTPHFDSSGRQIFDRSFGRFLLVVEGARGPSNRSPGSNLFPASSSERPDLQVLASRPLGDGSVTICDTGPDGGGVPGVNPPDFRAGQDVTDALTDMSCRFTVHFSTTACTKDELGNFAFLGDNTVQQFCYQIPALAALQDGDTILAVQMEDTSGNLGERKEILVRVGESSGVGVSGVITHYSSGAAVAGANVRFSGPTVFNTSSDEVGSYGLSGLVSNTWTVDVSKADDLGSAVSAFDASLILQRLVGKTSFDAQQQLACDVTGNGTVSSLDAARILQFVVEDIDRLPTAELCNSDWLFDPDPLPAPDQQITPAAVTGGTCQMGAIAFDPLSEVLTGQDFDAIPIGDCGSSEAGIVAGSGGSERIRARLGRPRRSRGRRVLVPLHVDSPAGFSALEMEVRFDPGQLRPGRVRRGRDLRGALLRTNRPDPSRLRIAAAAGEPVDSSRGPVLFIEMHRRDRARGLPLRVTELRIDDRPVAVRPPPRARR